MPKTQRETVGFDSGAPDQFWRWCFLASAVLLILAAGFVVFSFRPELFPTQYSSFVIPAILSGLACALVLHLVTLAQARQDQRKADTAFDTTDREFESVFRNTLDGILILDDQAVCLDANPAAFALLGAPPTMLVGHSFGQFYRERFEFDLEWRTFLERGYHRLQARLLRPDGSKVFVHLRATANYVPGRHVVILCDTTERVEAQDSLRESKERLQQMADNIQEIFWLLDASTKEVLQVNLAYETITGRSIESLMRDPTSYSDLIHAEDRVHMLAKLDEAVHAGHLDEEFRIVRPDGEVRWVWAHGFPVRDRRDGIFRRLAGTVVDITARKLADDEVAKHLSAIDAAREQAEAARAEAEGLRKATLALTQNLRMDAVLDTLLCCVRDLIPYDSAGVILTETDGRLFVARESPPASANRPVVTLEPDQNPFLQRILLMKKSVQLADTHEETDWRETKALANIRSWIAVPLIVGDSVLGLLSIGKILSHAFSTEHFRMAKSLAIPAAVAIHNARLYEWAEIYAAERQSLLQKADNPRTHPGEEGDRALPH
jgi:PAS domain S-box-containing protein